MFKINLQQFADPIVEDKNPPIEAGIPPVVESKPTVVDPAPPVVDSAPKVDVDAIIKAEQEKARLALEEKNSLLGTLQERLNALEDEKLSDKDRIKKQEERELARKLADDERRAEQEKLQKEKYDLIERQNEEYKFQISLTSIMDEKPHQKEKIKELMKSGLLKTEDDYIRMVNPFDKELKELHERKIQDAQINVGGNVFGTYQTSKGTDQRTEIQKKIDAYKEVELKRLGKVKK